MIEYGSQHARWPYQFGFENTGRVEPEYEGRHRQTDGEAYLQSEHLEWLLAGKPMSYIDCVSHPDIGWMHAHTGRSRCARTRRSLFSDLRSRANKIRFSQPSPRNARLPRDTL